MGARHRISNDQWANVAVFAMVASMLVYVFVVTSFTSQGETVMRAWPTPGEPANLEGWQVAGGARTLSADSLGWVVMAETAGTVAPAGAPSNATAASLQVVAELEPVAAATSGALPTLECFSGAGGGYEISFGDGVVRVVGGSLDASEPFEGATATEVAAAVSCDISNGDGEITISGVAGGVDRVTLTDPAPPSPGRTVIRLADATAVKFTAVEITSALR